MGNEHLQARDHWNYFLAVEEDVERFSRYVDFSEANMETYSIELARLLFASAAEAEVVARLLCDSIKPGHGRKDLEKFGKVICLEFPFLTELKVVLPRFSLECQPWAGWRKKKPDWWIAYNKVKHTRHEAFNKANLRNCLDALSGLFVLLLVLFKEDAAKGRLVPNPTILTVGPPHYRVTYPFYGEKNRTYTLAEHNAET